MGAQQFHVNTNGHKLRPQWAFRELVEAARYDHGHSGYTDTIAEKAGFAVYELPEGRTPEEVYRACSWMSEDRDWLPEGLYEAFDDKWGPAIAIFQDHVWHFMGWASS